MNFHKLMLENDNVNYPFLLISEEGTIGIRSDLVNSFIAGQLVEDLQETSPLTTFKTIYPDGSFGEATGKVTKWVHSTEVINQIKGN